MLQRYKIARCLLLDRLNERGITQTQLANNLLVSKQQVNDWVHMRKIMSAETLKTIIVFLQLEGIDDLYEFKT